MAITAFKTGKKSGKIVVPFSGKFGKRKTYQVGTAKKIKHITHTVTRFDDPYIFAIIIREDTSALWPRLKVTMVTHSNVLSKKSGGTITLLHVHDEPIWPPPHSINTGSKRDLITPLNFVGFLIKSLNVVLEDNLLTMKNHTSCVRYL